VSHPADTNDNFRSGHYSCFAAFYFSSASPNTVSKPNPTSIARCASGIRYAAYSEQKPLPIVITITRVNAKYYYRVDGPENLAHVSEGRCDVAGDRWESEATTKAFESLKSGRTWRLREEIPHLSCRSQFGLPAPPLHNWASTGSSPKGRTAIGENLEVLSLSSIIGINTLVEAGRHSACRFGCRQPTDQPLAKSRNSSAGRPLG
jgi:hypothetical protein